MSTWDTSIKRYNELHKIDYIDICNCHEPERFLRFDINSKKYFVESGCNTEFPCAKLQMNKHQIEILLKRRKLLDPYKALNKKEPKLIKTSCDQTLDKFFIEK